MTAKDDENFYPKGDLITLMEKNIPFNQYLGVKVVHFERGDITLKLIPKPEFTGDPLRQALHGGVAATLADTAGGLAVFSTLSKSSSTSTIDLRVDYLRPGQTDQALYANAKVIRTGNRVCVTHIHLYQGSKDEPIAISTATYNIVKNHADQSFESQSSKQSHS